jgi:hypothetical protein
MKGFKGTFDADPVDLIPEGSESGEPEDDYKFRGHFLDLRTLPFVLTDKGHTLASACKAFGVEQGKGSADRHGVVTPEYIDYNRQDVAATAALAFKLLDEYDRFGVDLQETQAYSPASLGKAHLRKMGIALSWSDKGSIRGISVMRNPHFPGDERALISEKFPFPSCTPTSCPCIPPSTS